MPRRRRRSGSLSNRSQAASSASCWVEQTRLSVSHYLLDLSQCRCYHRHPTSHVFEELEGGEVKIVMWAGVGSQGHVELVDQGRHLLVRERPREHCASCEAPLAQLVLQLASQGTVADDNQPQTRVS